MILKTKFLKSEDKKIVLPVIISNELMDKAVYFPWRETGIKFVWKVI